MTVDGTITGDENRRDRVLDTLCYYCSGEPSWIGCVRLVADIVHYMPVSFVHLAGVLVLCCAV